MALTREFIRKLAKESDVELPKEFIDAVVSEHLSVRDAYAEEQVKAELEKRATETHPTEETEEYKSLKKQFDDYKQEVETARAQEAKEKAYREVLKDANLNEKGVEKAIKYAKWDSITLDEDGKVKDAAEHMKNAKDEWAEYVSTTTTKGATTSTPPRNDGGTVMTRESIMQIKDASERRATIAKNLELFGKGDNN